MSFYKLNKDYLLSFQNNIFNRFNSHDKRSETALLKSILQEINELFRKIGGQLSSKKNMPSASEYPDSEKFNSFIQDIAFDINKLYNAQTLVESDTKNLINFDSTQRAKSFQNFVNAQQTVYSAYVKSKKDLIGGVEVPAGNPFILGDGSQNISFDQDRGSITLSADTATTRSANSDRVALYLTDKDTNIVQYPKSDTFGIGSHWKKSDTDIHFIDQTSSDAVSTYKSMMVDDPNNNVSVGYSEFEIVRTIYNYFKLREVKSILGGHLGLDATLIYIDQPNSFQGEYARDNPILSTLKEAPRYKLSIPFNEKLLTNEFVIEFTATPQGSRIFPSIDWEQSRIFSNVGGADTAHKFVASNEDAEDGRFVCKFMDFLYPTRAELALYYNGHDFVWGNIPFMMTHYIYYHTQRNYELSSSTDTKVSVSSSKVFNVFVDAEANSDNEKGRARGVLENPNKQTRVSIGAVTPLRDPISPTFQI